MKTGKEVIDDGFEQVLERLGVEYYYTLWISSSSFCEIYWGRLSMIGYFSSWCDKVPLF